MGERDEPSHPNRNDLKMEADAFWTCTQYLVKKTELKLKRRIEADYKQLNSDRILKGIFKQRLVEAKNGESRDEQTTLTDVGCVISRTGLCDHGCICYCWYRLNSKVTLTHDTCHIVLSEMDHSCYECHKEEKFKETVICSQLITSCRDIQFLTNKLWRHFGEHQLGHFVQTDGYDPHNPFGDYLWKIFGYARIGKVYAEELNLIK